MATILQDILSTKGFSSNGRKSTRGEVSVVFNTLSIEVSFDGDPIDNIPSHPPDLERLNFTINKAERGKWK